MLDSCLKVIPPIGLKNMASTITAIVPTFNRKNFLVESIASILSQTRPIDQILIIDDGSSDGTSEVVSKITGPIDYHKQENTGKSGALNAGLQLASGDYIWICDDDDIVLPRAAELLSRPLDNTSSSFSFGRYRRFIGDNQQNTFDGGYWPDNVADTWIALLEDFFPHQPGMMVRKTAYNTAGPFRTDLTRSQDYEMILRLARFGEASFVDEVVFLQREHDGERGSAKDRFAASGKFDKWVNYDKIIFKELYEKLDLLEYSNDRRQALLQRACIMFRHGLFSEAICDFRSAARMGGDSSPTDVELAIARRVLIGKYGCEQLADGRMASELRAAFGSGVWGRTVCAEVAKALIWRARNALQSKRLDLGKGYAGALCQMVGLGGAVQTLANSLLSKLG